MRKWLRQAFAGKIALLIRPGPCYSEKTKKPKAFSDYLEERHHGDLFRLRALSIASSLIWSQEHSTLFDRPFMTDR